jgi:hypothetical protein
MTENTISDFRGDYSFLSNFYFVVITLDGEQYCTVEHAYQASKTTDKLERKVIQMQDTPGMAKAFGNSRTVMRHYRPDWDKVKVDVMLDLLRQKFSQPDLKAKLLDTGDALLVEGNTWHDNFFGSCTCPKCGNKGQNTLGILLMVVRGEVG